MRRRSCRGVLLLAGAIALAGIGCSKESSSQGEKRSTSEVEDARGAAGDSVPREEPVLDPVSGEPVTSDDAPTAIFLDEIYHFASDSTLAIFRGKPEEYATTACPVTGEPVWIPGAVGRAEYGGRSWYFNTKSALVQFNEAPEKYATYRCPGCGISGLMSRPTVLTKTLDGRDLHFCCTHCIDAFMEHATETIASIVPEGGTSRARN